MEERCFTKAEKVAYSEINSRYNNLFYWEGYEIDDGFFHEMSDLVDYCKEKGIPQPVYVWATKETIIELDADHILERACTAQDIEDVYERVDKVDIERLQEMLDEWCGQQSSSQNGYTVDYSTAIILGE